MGTKSQQNVKANWAQCSAHVQLLRDKQDENTFLSRLPRYSAATCPIDLDERSLALALFRARGGHHHPRRVTKMPPTINTMLSTTSAVTVPPKISVDNTKPPIGVSVNT
jgi:hypothetical protein